MKRRWILGVGLALSVVAVAWMLFPRESVYEGRTTSQWLATLKAGTDREREKAVTALQRIGGEAVEGASALLAHPDAEVRLAAFDVLEGVLESCNQNFQTMNCITGYVPGRRRAARALPPIAEAVTVCRFSEDETLRRRAESAIVNIPWYYAVVDRATAERLLDVLCAALEADDDETRDRVEATLQAVVQEVSAWQSDLLKPTADRLLDAAVRQDSPSEPLMRSLLLCLVMVPQDLDFTERVQAIETHVTRMLVTRSLSQSEPLKTGMWSHARYGDASVRYWAASALLRYGSTDAVPALGEALKDEDANVSRTARAALQRIGGPRAMEVLERAAESRR